MQAVGRRKDDRPGGDRQKGGKPNFPQKPREERPVRLPAGRWKEWEIEIETTARVTEVVIASSTQELQAV